MFLEIKAKEVIVDEMKRFRLWQCFRPSLKQRTNFLGTTYKLPEIPGSLYVRTNFLTFQDACTYTYKLTKISVSLYVRTNLLDVQTYSNIYMTQQIIKMLQVEKPTAEV